ncbi:hypothetical protein FOA52_005550, partial [Chlamydomonas sp. UWO 241]
MEEVQGDALPSDEWKAALERVVSCVVVLNGPIVADAIFLNREELPVRPVYRDPVHDFGFLRFDPTKLQ